MSFLGKGGRVFATAFEGSKKTGVHKEVGEVAKDEG
jgi:hypothetical protein